MNTWSLELPVDTRTFGPHQVLPREVLGFTMTGFAGWMRHNLVPFPGLIREHQTGVVILNQHIRYVRDFRFFDGDAFTLRAHALKVHGNGRLVTQRYELVHDDVPFVTCDGVGRIVRLVQAGDFGAKPSTLPAELLDRIAVDDQSSKLPARLMPELPPGATLVAQGSHPLRIERHQCEVAEQWCYIDVVSHAEIARTSLALGKGVDGRAKAGLTRPFTCIDVSYQSPMFVFDCATVETQLYADGDDLVWFHQILSTIGQPRVHATVFERQRT